MPTPDIRDFSQEYDAGFALAVGKALAERTSDSTMSSEQIVQREADIALGAAASLYMVRLLGAQELGGWLPSPSDSEQLLKLLDRVGES